MQVKPLDCAISIQASELSEIFPDFEERPSYDGDCEKRPVKTVCVQYPDGYIWLIKAGVMGSREYTSNGHTVTVAIGADGYDYYHVNDTKLVKKTDTGEVLPFEPDQWLKGPDREDFSWDVRLIPPAPTLQQRYRVGIKANFEGGSLRDRKIQQNLHFVLKVAIEDDNWVPGYSHTRILFPPKVNQFNIIMFQDYVYLRPGRYTIALIAYDPILKKGNLWRKKVRISPPRGDRLPELEKNLPYVEFAKEQQLAGGREWLPVNNSRKLCIDTVVNISMDWNYDPSLSRRWRTSRWYRGGYVLPNVNLGTILQAASVLSHIEPLNGRHRVSIVDTLRMKTLYDREDAATFDWKTASRAVSDWHNENLPKREKRADGSTSAVYPGMPMHADAYLHDRLQEILEDDTCASDSEDPLRAVIIVSPEMLFGRDVIIQQIEPQDPSSFQFYYFRIPKGTTSGDDLQKMLKRAKPRTLTVRDPRSFRRDLADLISDLKKQAQ